MFPSKALVSLVLIALSVVDASPLTRRSSTAKLSLTRRISQLQEGTTVADLDRARAQAMINAAHPSKRQTTQPNVPITNKFVSYTAQVGVGSPPTYYDLIIDTGSSNTFVGTNTPYVPTSSSQRTSDSVSVSYGSGSFSGTEYTDTVTLSDTLVIQGQFIGVASESRGFQGVDGILGVGPVALTVGTLSPDTFALIPTVVDNLFTQGTITAHELGVYFTPADAPDQAELTFGSTDPFSGHLAGEVTYVPITSTSPASNYWGIDQSIYYGSYLLQSTTAGIVDTGTTLVLLATDVFQEYQKLTGGDPDKVTGLLKITSDQYDLLQPLFFNVNGAEFMLMPNAQIWPRSLNSAIGGTPDGIYLIIADIGTNSGAGLDFINGQTFLERFYSVYDTADPRVGLALTPHTFDESN